MFRRHILSSIKNICYATYVLVYADLQYAVNGVLVTQKKICAAKITGASVIDIKYSSSDKTVATVNSEGKISAKQKGMAIITVKLGSVQEKVTVTVKDAPVPKISGLKDSYTLSAGKELKLSYTIKDAGDMKVSVSEGNTKYKVTDGLYMDVAVVEIVKVTDKYAAIRGLEKGKTTLTIKVGAVSKKVTITVK